MGVQESECEAGIGALVLAASQAEAALILRHPFDSMQYSS